VVSAADHARDCGLDWSLYERCFDTNQQRAFTLLSALSFAVNAPDQLSLVYQPRINLGTGQCSSVEALLRWVHPTLGPVAPDEFVRLAEKTALMRPLSLWVLEATLTQARIWHDQGCRFKVAMNVSPADLESSDFTDKLIAGLQRHGVSPAMLEIEFTESALIKNPTQVRRQLQRMRELDIEVAIDDFGTGYSNWTYLRELPATTVKLDRSLVSNIYTDEKDRRLVSTLIDLAQRLGYRVVAEGIEDGETLALVKQWGCDEAQGFFIARPMLGDELTAWVDSVEGCHSGMARCESHCG
jgi:EAL domain-containing protein (putative c-di-GMP-specific phosphodiesterase class I)